MGPTWDYNDRQCSDQPRETTRRSQTDDANYIQPPMEPQTITIARDNAPCASAPQTHNERNVIQRTMRHTEENINQQLMGINIGQQLPKNHANNTQRTSIQLFVDNSNILAANNKRNWNKDQVNQKQNGQLHPNPTSTTPTPSSNIRKNDRQPNTGQGTNSSQRPSTHSKMDSFQH